MTRRKKDLAKEMREYILVSYLIDGETWLHGLGGLAVYYLSSTPFEILDDGYTTKFRLGMVFVTWCIFKLDCYVTCCRAFHIIIIANDISHLRIKMISWSWGVGDVTKL